MPNEQAGTREEAGWVTGDLQKLEKKKTQKAPEKHKM